MLKKLKFNKKYRINKMKVQKTILKNEKNKNRKIILANDSFAINSISYLFYIKFLSWPKFRFLIKISIFDQNFHF